MNEASEQSNNKNVPTYSTPEEAPRAQPVLMSVEVQPEQTRPQPRIIYFYDSGERFESTQQPSEDEAGICCAMTGFIFSWIPIVGLFTFLCNLDADRNSLRRKLGCMACLVATFVIIFNCIFFVLFYRCC